MLGGYPKQFGPSMMAGATESRRFLVVHIALIIIFTSQFSTLQIIYYC